ncbi:MAG: hypothetical protein CMG50_00140 [Candidatus Marinimicrobia bacterium]|nr:hypothetical protein [Candidatus Neomarinimicrobiota bacterium]MBV19626.1 hypothetical protein [Cytophagia bacterium]|tara:strand:+ start:4866 stop:5150 length:285 start_codon:yes stop_codon:yes gene_type:complete
MYREFIILSTVVVLSLFMTIHNSNKEEMKDSQTKLSIQRRAQENILMEEGNLMKLNGGVTFRKNSNLIIIKDPYSTIVLDKNDVEDIIVFLEEK